VIAQAHVRRAPQERDPVGSIATRRRTTTSAPPSANTRLRQLATHSRRASSAEPVRRDSHPRNRTDLCLTEGPLHTRQPERHDQSANRSGHRRPRRTDIAIISARLSLSRGC
jgi:hypothetical protein